MVQVDRLAKVGDRVFILAEVYIGDTAVEKSVEKLVVKLDCLGVLPDGLLMEPLVAEVDAVVVVPLGIGQATAGDCQDAYAYCYRSKLQLGR